LSSQDAACVFSAYVAAACAEVLINLLNEAIGERK